MTTRKEKGPARSKKPGASSAERLAAERIPAAVLHPLAGHGVFAGIAGTVPCPLESPDRLAALEEQIGHADVLAAPAVDEAALRASHQGDLIGERVIGTAV